VLNELVLGVAKRTALMPRRSSLRRPRSSLSHTRGGGPVPPPRDELLFDAYPFASDHEVYSNTLWAVTDCTEEMGATRVVPGSHTLVT
jgi:hypothetical protein